MVNNTSFTGVDGTLNSMSTSYDNDKNYSWAMTEYSNNLYLTKLPSDINSRMSRENIPWINISSSPNLVDLGDLSGDRLKGTLSKSLNKEHYRNH